MSLDGKYRVMLTDNQIASVADRVLSDHLSSTGYDSSYVRVTTGRDGDPLISIVAVFKPGTAALDGKSTIRTIAALHDALRSSGEERESILRYAFPDQDAPAIEESEFVSSEP